MKERTIRVLGYSVVPGVNKLPQLFIDEIENRIIIMKGYNFL